jgi:hypothetical protein
VKESVLHEKVAMFQDVADKIFAHEKTKSFKDDKQDRYYWIKPAVALHKFMRNFSIIPSLQIR